MVTDYRAHSADRKLPCIAIEAGPEAFDYDGNGNVHSEVGLDLIVITKGQDREKTRETLSALMAGMLQVLWKHGDLDGFANGTIIGEPTRDVVPAEKAKTVAGARIPIVVSVSTVASRRGGPSVPDEPAPEPLPPVSPEWADHTETNLIVSQLD